METEAVTVENAAPWPAGSKRHVLRLPQRASQCHKTNSWRWNRRVPQRPGRPGDRPRVVRNLLFCTGAEP